MKIFRRIMLWTLVAGIVSFIVVPLVIPVTTSGTLTNREAATSGEFVSLNGLDVHVETREYSGDCACQAPLIILMHGFGASTFSWRDVMQPLTEAGMVIAYDRPGFGFTERPTSWSGENPYGFAGNFALLDALISNFGAGREIVLVGHSAGGELAADYARLNPSKVQRLVLADPAILTTGTGPEWLYSVLNIPQMKTLGPLLVRGIATSGDDLLRQSYTDPTKLTQAVYDGYHQPLKVAGWESAFWDFTIAPRANALVGNLRKIATPTLLITGDNDTVVPTSDAQKLATLIPNSTLALIPLSGHLPQEEQPELFAEAVTDWLAVAPKNLG
jgi:pimeloyl-ACP methyl ester carboxylesterase